MTATYLDVALLRQAEQAIGLEIEGRTDLLITGSLSDFADYRYRCGEIQGMMTAINIMKMLVHKMADNSNRNP